VRVLLLTTAALVGFCANSLLTRKALGADLIDPVSFMTVRLVTGALTLWVLSTIRRAPATSDRGSWLAAAALAGYAIAFTMAYTSIGAGVGALLLFGAVQVTMIATGLVRGHRPGSLDWTGVSLALVGLVVLTRPGQSAPDVIGALLMVVAGACWGGYSMAGRASRDPLGATTWNFGRASAASVVFALTARTWSPTHAGGAGLWLAAASGSLASGVGYTLWYAALPSLSPVRAAVVQMSVPVATALAAALLLGEALTLRLAIAAALVAAGVLLTARKKPLR
jgi:drug/metabolite transporter (DMT)-like permease